MLGQYVTDENGVVYERDMDTEAEDNFDSDSYNERVQNEEEQVDWWEYITHLSKIAPEELDRIYNIDDPDMLSEDEIEILDMSIYCVEGVENNSGNFDIRMRRYEYDLLKGYHVTRETIDNTFLLETIKSNQWLYDTIMRAYKRADSYKKYYSKLSV
jgi:hypothetical protein